jgi:hypothetical protein
MMSGWLWGNFIILASIYQHPPDYRLQAGTPNSQNETATTAEYKSEVIIGIVRYEIPLT